ncbi:MAG TPA: hypothetical protein VEL73_05595 [Mycobacteriales bacterium]|nr:hypothetical protein [Mycobacteriales bacterium]
MGQSGPALALGLVEILLAALIPVATIWVLMHLERIGGWVVAGLRFARLLPRRKDDVRRPPVERLAADLRRLSAACLDCPRGTSHARRTGLLTAYDGALVAACDAMEVPQSLDALPAGMDRELERIRVEAAIEAAGLRFRSGVPRDRTAWDEG